MKKLYNLNGLDIPLLLKKEGFKDSFILSHETKYYYFLSKILYKNSMGLDGKNGFVKLSSDELMQKLGQCGLLKNNLWFNKKGWKNKHLYLMIREQLYDWGVIHFKTIQKSETKREAQYKILDEWLDKGYYKLEQPIDNKFIEQINKPITNYKGVYRQLQDNLSNVKINKEDALRWLQVSHENEYKLASKRNNIGKIINRAVNTKILSEWETMIDNCIENPWFSSDLGKTGRVYSSFTSLPKQLRQFVSYNDKLLVEIDISNCQPLIFSILIQKWNVENSILINQADVDKYIQLCEAGGFYKYIEDLMIQNDEIITYRELFKTDFFSKIFFSTEKRKYKWRNIFEKEFPTISKCITELKSQTKVENLAVRLQVLESDIMIKGVANELFKRGIYEFYTIHDAIYTTVENQFLVMEIIRNEFLQQGLRPSIKAKADYFEYILMKCLPATWVGYNYAKGIGLKF